MRMWMIDPDIMCDKHLIGEHGELHMIVGAMLKYKKLDGFAENNCLELSSLQSRHDALVEEINLRGFIHNSILLAPRNIGKINKTYYRLYEVIINRSQALSDLLKRCPKCKNKYKEMYNL